jgi:hypothetical protein
MASEYLMLRFRILASVVPLAVAAVLARGDLFAASRPCVAVADISVQLTSLPWQSDLHVAFTSDPARATVRVEVTESAETADFAVIDDIDNADAGACPTGRPQLVSISASPSASEPVIFLTRQGPADYRIYVHSRTFSVRDAAALIVAARGGVKRVQAASLPVTIR